MSFHSNQTGGSVHVANAFTYANSAARVAATLASTDIGKIALQSDTKSYWILQNNSPTTWAQINGGGGVGGINYISNPDAESGLTGWATYLNTAQATPVTGTGGSPTVTLTSNISTPLRGLASFLLTKGAANDQGQGVSANFTIDPADQGNMLSVGFNYHAPSPFAASTGAVGNPSDIEVFVYDVTNSLLLPVSPNSLLANGTSNWAFQGTFQASPNSTSYRLILHIATTNASAWTFGFDNVSVGPTETSGVVATPSATIAAKYHNNAASVYALTPTPQNVVYPTLEIDTNSAYDNGTGFFTAPVTGTYFYTASLVSLSGFSGANDWNLSMYKNNTVVTDGDKHATSNSGDTTNSIKISGIVNLVAGDTLNVKTAAAISQTITLDSSVNLNGLSIFLIPSPSPASSGATPLVAVRAVNTIASAAVGLAQPLVWDTSEIDTTRSMNNTTGIFTAPVSGIYSVSISMDFGSVDSIYLFKNAALYCQVSYSAGNVGTSGTTIIQLVAGDTLDARTGTNQAANGNRTFNFIDIYLISTLANATPVGATNIALGYTNASAQSIPDSTYTIATNFTLEYDTNAAFDPTAGLFTAPVAGIYRFSGTFSFLNFTGANCQINLTLNKNGASTFKLIGGERMSNTVNQVGIVNGSGTLKLVAGDVIAFEVYQSGNSAAKTLNPAGSFNSIAIEKIG